MISFRQAVFQVALATMPIFGIGCVSLTGQSRCPQSFSACNNVMNAARSAESHGNLSRAKQLYEMVHQQDPRNVDCLHRLGVVCTRLKQPGQAEHYYRKAYKVAPYNSEILADMGYSAFLRKEFGQSEAFLEQSVRLNDKDPRTINNLAIARAWCGKDESSLTTFRVANSEAESRRLLTAIQVARGDQTRIPTSTDVAGNARLLSPANPVSPAAPASLVTPIGPDSVVQTTAYDSDLIAIELPSPSHGETPVELPLFSAEASRPLEPSDQPSRGSVTVTFDEIIELPPQLPPFSSMSLPHSSSVWRKTRHPRSTTWKIDSSDLE